MDVYASLTTIPSRGKILKKCLDSLINQVHPIKKILLTIPIKSLRTGEKMEPPSYLYAHPYDKMVKIIRCKKDYGPVMKYIGGYKELPKKSLVFICDDDQQYNHNVVNRLVDRYNQDEGSVVCGDSYTIFTTNTVRGIGSIIMNQSTIKTIRYNIINSSKYVKKSCQNVDDNWVSAILKRNNIKVIKLNLTNYQRYIGGKTYNPDDGLASNTNRYKDIVVCTYAIDHENNYPIVALIVVIMFIFSLLIYNYLF